MARLALLIIGVSAAAFPAMAQSPVIPAAPGYAANPSAAPGLPISPVQQQVMQNYRAQLQQTERELLQQNPSGLSRDQLQVNRELNAANPAYNPTIPGYVAGAQPDLGVVPSPPFNAPPR